MGQRSWMKAEDALLVALACGVSVEQAARQCGLCSRTVSHRFKAAAMYPSVNCLHPASGGFAE
jgi:hypothetical protein